VFNAASIVTLEIHLDTGASKANVIVQIDSPEMSVHAAGKTVRHHTKRALV
jgi:hypothetical protein